MTAAFARLLYASALWLATPLFFARLWWRGRREPVYLQHWPERLGFGTAGAPVGRIWIHAVSLGETLAAQPLIEALRAQRPASRFLITHGTATGRAAGAALLQPGDAQAWLPYDTPAAVKRFLRTQRPALGVLMETEIWPALMHGAQSAAVPMVLANARLSERSLRKGLRLAHLMQPAVAGFTRVLAQTASDAARLISAGATPAVVHTMGNLKFDLTPPAALHERGAAWHAQLQTAHPRSVVLMASSRAGEEAALLAAWLALPMPRPLLLLVPRHPQRFAEVQALLAAAGLFTVRRSSWGAAPPAAVATADVWLGDSVGEMPLYYAAADVALLGGSFEPLGGHNLIEAAACACPLVMGPHTFNFSDAAELSLAAGAGLREATMAQAVQRAVLLAANRAERDTMAAAAQAFAAQHRGAAARMAAQVLQLL